MWHHCIVCSADLGANEDLERFPIGRRLAFDPERGRLWVVCGRCERWNLVPMEVRWEVVEALEEAYRSTPARYATAEIGLARLPAGLEVVRVGRPVPGEFAAWRWASRFGRRRRGLRTLKTPAASGGGKIFGMERRTALVSGLVLAPLAPVLAPVALVASLGYLASRLQDRWVVDADDPERISRSRLRAGGITPSDQAPGWSLHLQHWVRHRQGPSAGVDVLEWREYSGEEAIRLARRALPLVNRRSARFSTVGDAVRQISEAGGVDRYLTHAAGLKPKWVPFRHYPREVLLAMEMALFEDEERRALEGELERLEEAWREAEELAAISDALLPPRGWAEFRAEVEAAGAGEPPDVTPPEPAP